MPLRLPVVTRYWSKIHTGSSGCQGERRSGQKLCAPPSRIVDFTFPLWYVLTMNVPALMATYQLRQREYLLRITRAMTSRLDLPSLLRLILESAAEMLAAPAGVIVLDDETAAVPLADGRSTVEDDEPFRIRAAYGIPRQLLPAFRPLLKIASQSWPPSEDRLADEEANHPAMAGDWEAGRAVAAAFSLGDSYQQDIERRVREIESALGRKLGQVIGLPLLFEEDLLGVIYLFRGDSAFSPLDWQFLQGFADQAAIAVRNARLYQQLTTERSRLTMIVQNSVNGMMILAPNKRVEVINQPLSVMTGIPPHEAIGQPCEKVLPLLNLHGEDLCSADYDVESLPEDGARSEGDIVLPDGGQISVSVTFIPVKDERKRLLNIIANVLDITRFREEEEMKSTFTSIISHELKTPVALIKGYAQTLARPDAAWDAETARQSLEVIEEEADRLEALINSLLEVSRIQAGGLRLERSDLQMRRLLERVAQDYRTQTDTHEIALDLPPDLPVINGDEERLRLVFTNLLSNAIKYSPDGGVIRIGGWQEEPQEKGAAGRLVLYVADEGIGIPARELPRIFERYYRVDSGLRRRTAGVGLGLFLSKAIVEAHHGEIWVRSDVNKGTTVFVALPVDDIEVA